MALTSWEYIELALADMFVLFIGAPEESPPRDPVVRAYGSVASFNSRADMVGAAGESYLHPDEKKKPSDPKLEAVKEKLRNELRGLFKTVRGFGDRRNDIAHGIVGSSQYGSFLRPASYNARKYPIGGRLTVHQRARFCWSAEEVHYYRRHFEDLHDRLQKFCTNLRHMEASKRLKIASPPKI
jgi:hypothetical protein